jgi:hypothetical protein
MKRPSFQFYPGDWLRATELRSCSVGARGLWIDMICLMHEGSPYGHLKVADKVIHQSNLARMVGATIAEVEGWLAELEEAGVFSRTDDGCIYSRRMVRDEDVRCRRAAGGVLGGNPALLKVIHPPNLHPTPASASASASAIPPTTSTKNVEVVGATRKARRRPAAPPTCPHDEIVELYHAILPDHPKVELINPARERHLNAWWKRWMDHGSRPYGDPPTVEGGLNFWRRFFEHAGKQPNLTGKTPARPPYTTPFVADFDYLIGPESHMRTAEARLPE